MKELAGLRILVVDDEPDLREVIRQYFELKGAKIWTASNGNEAFEIAKSSELDLILSDVRMPKGDGPSFLKKFRALHPEKPVFFFMTGFSDITPEQAKRMGAQEIIAKPFDIDLLISTVQRYFKPNNQ